MLNELVKQMAITLFEEVRKYEKESTSLERALSVGNLDIANLSQKRIDAIRIKIDTLETLASSLTSKEADVTGMVRAELTRLQSTYK